MNSFRMFRRYVGIWQRLCEIGLDYLTLGQSAPTLSGGEAQRIKLASELAKPNTGRTLYILDEPTTGLHFDDIAKLLKVLNSLVEAGNTVVVIEHNLDVIKTADWIIDLGPEAGSEGGLIVAEGTPEDIVEQFQLQRKRKRNLSATAEFLAPLLAQGTRKEREHFDVEEIASHGEKDVSIKQLGEEQELPWKKNGRQWHTVDRLSHQGKPVNWEGRILSFIIDEIESSEGFAKTNWNNRSIVEITNERKKGNLVLSWHDSRGMVHSTEVPREEEDVHTGGTSEIDSFETSRSD